MVLLWISREQIRQKNTRISPIETEIDMNANNLVPHSLNIHSSCESITFTEKDTLFCCLGISAADSLD